jgi:hypothetical protein
VRNASDEAERLFAVEPNNTDWMWRAAEAHLELSNYLLGIGKIQDAAEQIGAGCRLTSALMARDSKEADWQKLQRDCFEAQFNLALASGSKPQAISFATQAIAAAKAVRSTDPLEDRYGVARAYRHLGDVERSAGNGIAAHNAWVAGLGIIPPNITETPPEMSQHQMLLQRLGRQAEAAQLAKRLSAMGYREPEFRSA